MGPILPKKRMRITRNPNQRPGSIWKRIERLVVADAARADARVRRHRDNLSKWGIKGGRAKRRNRIRRSRAASRARYKSAPRTAVWRARWSTPLRDRYRTRMLLSMEPGCWYGRLDLVAVLGLPAGSDRERGARAAVNCKLLAPGLVERARNPHFAGVPSPQKIAGGAEPEPEWLYRLTPAGEAERERLRLLLGDQA